MPRPRFALLVPVIAVFAACASGSTGPSDIDVGSGGASAEARSGEETFRSRCASCHGPEGAGTTRAPQIQNPVAGFASYVVRTGRDQMGFPGSMPSFTEDEVSDADLETVIAFLQSASKPVQGADLYARFCSNCHGAAGRGGRVGKNIVEEANEGSGELTEHVREGHGGVDYGAREDYMPAWRSSFLTDAEVAAIADYLATQPSTGAGGAGGGKGEGGPGEGGHGDDDDDDD